MVAIPPLASTLVHVYRYVYSMALALVLQYFGIGVLALVFWDSISVLLVRVCGIATDRFTNLFARIIPGVGTGSTHSTTARQSARRKQVGRDRNIELGQLPSCLSSDYIQEMTKLALRILLSVRFVCCSSSTY